MKKALRYLLIIVIPLYILCCCTDDAGAEKNNNDFKDTLIFNDTIDINDTINLPDTVTNDTIDIPGNYQKDTIILNFEYGVDLSPTAYKNIYVVWLEAPGFIQNIFICNKLIKGGVTGTALPYWKINKYPLSNSSEVDAVTSATVANSDFNLEATVKDSTIKQFTIYFEIDRSFDANDWFSDQPALLYAAEINLENAVSQYTLMPVGWTPNENTQNVIANTPMGILQSEMRYITNLKNETSFGGADSRSATSMVKKITVSVK